MTIEAKNISSKEIYNLMIGSILPRPIAWVGSTSKDEIKNLAAFSFFSVASVNPPVLSFSILNKEKNEVKATLKNINDTKYFSISIVNKELAQAMAVTSKKHDGVKDKFEIANITKEDCSIIPSFYVKEALVSYECKLKEIINFGEEAQAGNLVLADVIAINIDEEVLSFPNIDIEKLDPIGRLSASFYSTIENKFEIIKNN